MDWDVLVTAGLGIWGAGLSTYNAIARRRDKASRVRVSVSWSRYLSLDGQTSEPHISVAAANHGQGSVRLCSVGLRLPNRNQMFLTASAVEFPYDLAPGAAVDADLSVGDAVANLRQQGYTGQVSVRGFYKDALSNRYLSKRFKMPW